ncbi:MAG: S49 family peptidase [Bacteroidota bacterium]|nr:S49 family peptidase [Bacteroidota bacterium]
MKKLCLIILFITASFVVIFPQSPQQSYYNQNRFSLTSPGAMRYGLYGSDNPAMLSTVTGLDMLLNFSSKGGNKAFYAAVPNFGFSVFHQAVNGLAVNDFRLSTGFGSGTISMGLAYGWSSGEKTAFNRADVFSAGLLTRPFKYFSLGFWGNFSSVNDEGIVDAAIRPFGNEFVSFFADYAFRKNEIPNENKWSAGATIEVFNGIRITGRYFENKAFTLGTEISLGRIGISSQEYFNTDGKYDVNSYGIRLGSLDRTIFKAPDSKYISYSLNGDIKYQRFKWFDNSNTLLNLLDQIRSAKDDNSISGIVINTSGLSINQEQAWELRKELSDFKSKGKHVVIYIDRANITLYHFASVADKIILDPLGGISLEGYAMSRTFYKDMLEKLGIGFREFRYFKYKSAVENFTRNEMSPADKEQRKALVEGYYNTAKYDICANRNISHSDFDSLTNSLYMVPGEALKNKLIDTIARFTDLNDIVNKFENDNKSFISGNNLDCYLLPKDNYWGKKPEIAVIYAIGECAMDQGINARSLINYVNKAVNDNNVKAIVFRVDSPGGDALASDLVADALKKAKGKKPVIVTQGYVAGSGGYWLSMYGDTIMAAPNTITGSIGVIGAWYYEKGLKDKLGLNIDNVKIGRHADLGVAYVLPILNLAIAPYRDFTQDELNQQERTIKNFYSDFVSKVSLGRHKSYEAIDSIAQGRVWTGLTGKNIGLVDIIGNLNDAVKLAEVKTGLKKEDYNLIEMPEPGLINFNSFLPKFINTEFIYNSEMDFLMFRLKNNGVIMPIMPLD